MKRREFIALAGAGTMLLHPLTRTAFATSTTQFDIKAVCFDAFPIFNPKPLLKLGNDTFPNIPDFSKQWFNKIFAYTWLRTSGSQYKGFEEIIEDALIYTVQSNKLQITETQKTALLQAWLELKVWPDVPAAINHLQQNKIRLSFLSNFSEKMLRANAKNNGLESAFEYLSTDKAEAFKPHPNAYRLGTEHYNLPKKNIAFCPFASWDAAGAKWFGYPTIWINRLNFTPEKLQATPDATGNTMQSLTDFVSSNNKPI